jgi:hypothetical protein
MSLPISLTSISSRLSILPKTLRSLLTQTLKPEGIHIFLSKEPFGLDQGCTSLPLELQTLLATEPLLHLHWTENLGPHTKLLPFAKLFPNTPVLVVDDDTIHEPTFIETAFQLWKEHQCCISFRATIMIPDIPYRFWLDAAGEKAIPIFHKGNGGIVYHTSWFQDPRIQDSQVFLKLCPTADDIWFNVWRMRQGILCYCTKKPMIQKSLPVPVGLFQTNESKNDAILKDVLKYISSL